MRTWQCHRCAVLTRKVKYSYGRIKQSGAFHLEEDDGTACRVLLIDRDESIRTYEQDHSAESVGRPIRLQTGDYGLSFDELVGSWRQTTKSSQALADVAKALSRAHYERLFQSPRHSRTVIGI
jgi:hypothetical protein